MWNFLKSTASRVTLALTALASTAFGKTTNDTAINTLDTSREKTALSQTVANLLTGNKASVVDGIRGKNTTKAYQAVVAQFPEFDSTSSAEFFKDAKQYIKDLTPAEAQDILTKLNNVQFSTQSHSVEIVNEVKQAFTADLTAIASPGSIAQTAPAQRVIPSYWEQYQDQKAREEAAASQGSKDVKVAGSSTISTGGAKDAIVDFGVPATIVCELDEIYPKTEDGFYLAANSLGFFNPVQGTTQRYTTSGIGFQKTFDTSSPDWSLHITSGIEGTISDKSSYLADGVGLGFTDFRVISDQGDTIYSTGLTFNPTGALPNTFGATFSDGSLTESAIYANGANAHTSIMSLGQTLSIDWQKETHELRSASRIRFSAGIGGLDIGNGDIFDDRKESLFADFTWDGIVQNEENCAEFNYSVMLGAALYDDKTSTTSSDPFFVFDNEQIPPNATPTGKEDIPFVGPAGDLIFGDEYVSPIREMEEGGLVTRFSVAGGVQFNDAFNNPDLTGHVNGYVAGVVGSEDHVIGAGLSTALDWQLSEKFTWVNAVGFDYIDISSNDNVPHMEGAVNGVSGASWTAKSALRYEFDQDEPSAASIETSFQHTESLDNKYQEQFAGFGLRFGF